LLAALVLWRTLVTAGPAAVGRTIYWGTAPRDPATLAADSRPELVDVLATAASGVEARFSVDEAGRVVAIDLWTTSAADPCEVRFEWPPDSGQALDLMPTRMTVGCGGQPFGTFVIDPPAGARGATP
jgi:hypothetical protein